jgi:Xaa-Pro aminopeptidase
MVVSNEPGLYRSGEYGIRIENLIVVKEHCSSAFGQFYAFETLTLFPYDTSAIEQSLLTEEEKNFINAYHERVYRKLSPYLTKTECKWLARKTKAI